MRCALIPEPSPEVYCYEDRAGIFWIFHITGTNVLATFDRKDNRLRYYSFHGPDPTSTAVTGVTAMIEDQKGNPWLSTRGAGLLRFDRDHQTFIRYRYGLANPSRLEIYRPLAQVAPDSMDLIVKSRIDPGIIPCGGTP